MARHEPGAAARGLVRVGEASSVCGHRETGGPVPGLGVQYQGLAEIVPPGKAPAQQRPRGTRRRLHRTRPARVHAASASITPSTTPQLTRRLIISLPVHTLASAVPPAWPPKSRAAAAERIRPHMMQTECTHAHLGNSRHRQPIRS